MNKYSYVKILQSNHGYGWYDVLEFSKDENIKDRKQMLKTYRENDHKAFHRIIERRILNTKEDITQC